MLHTTEQIWWQERRVRAHQLVGSTEAEIVEMSQATLHLLFHNVQAELTLGQVGQLQSLQLTDLTGR